MQDNKLTTEESLKVKTVETLQNLEEYDRIVKLEPTDLKQSSTMPPSLYNSKLKSMDQAGL